jgi:hypothetical protein
LELRVNGKSLAHLCDLITFSNVKQKKILESREDPEENGKCFQAVFSTLEKKKKTSDSKRSM